MTQKEVEGGATAPSEYSIGSKVLILQHSCFPNRLGSYGRVTKMQGAVPLEAKCDDCSQIIGVNLKAIQELGRPRRPKA